VTMVVRAVGPDDAASFVAVHRLAFPDSALTALGDEAVRRYYRWQLTGPHDAVALAAFDGSEVVGFCVAGVFRGALSGFLRANRLFLLGVLVRRPWLLSRAVVRERIAGRLRPPPTATPAAPPAYGILVIAVAPDRRREGIGGALLRVTEDDARSRGFDRIRLTVDADNEPAVRFYEAAGWVSTGAGAMERALLPS
jgi:ribosomal protein S18 acetylase RimI-like enzyme